MSKFIAPKLNKVSFNCPHCKTLTSHKWDYFEYNNYGENCQQIEVSWCYACDKSTLWIDGEMKYPLQGDSEEPIEGMPENVRTIYEEAQQVLPLSPRASCALLRLAVETLLSDLEIEGKSIDNKIANLVKNGLPDQVQKALDSVRVIGNESIHPGQMDLSDDYATANSMFELINFIVDDRINRPKRIDSLYDSLPENKIEGIKNRDKRIVK